LKCKVPGTSVIIHRVRSTIHHTGMPSGDITRLLWLPHICRDMHFSRASAIRYR